MTISKEEAKKCWRKLVVRGADMGGVNAIEWLHAKFDELLDQVELIGNPQPVVVSPEEAKILEQARNPEWRPAAVISKHAFEHGGWKLESDLEDRLMRAYVNGWVIEKPKPKQWYVKVPGWFCGGERYYWKTGEDDFVDTAKLLEGDPRFIFNETEISHFCLKGCELVEVVPLED